jgi:hypothetical protein
MTQDIRMLCEYAGFTLHPRATRLRPHPPKLACEMHTKKHKEKNVNTKGEIDKPDVFQYRGAATDRMA